MRKIVLVGFRGCGKSTVGRALAGRLGRPFIDVDDEMERQTGLALSDFIDKVGWEGFRREERELIRRLCRRSSYVMAPGGGAVLDGQNVTRLRRDALVFWLRADGQTTLERLARDPRTLSQRPALTALPPAEEVRRLLEEREPFYRAAADFEVETSERSIDQVVDNILRVISICREARGRVASR